MLIEDLHTHTVYSHGKGTVEQNVLAAIQKGLARIGIAEHGPKHLFFPVKWDALLRLRHEIDRLNDRYGDKIQVLMGLEANLLGDGLTDVPEDTSLFDYLMLGYHKGTAPCDALSRGWTRALLFGQRKRHGKNNALAYVHAMEQLPKLINISHPGTYIPVDIATLARAAAAQHVTLELNESHQSVSINDIHAARAEGAKFYLSSDAHHPRNVGNVQNSVALARAAGVLDQVVNWQA